MILTLKNLTHLIASVMVLACSPAAETPAESEPNAATNASDDPNSGFETGSKSTTVTGASIADLDFTCTSEFSTSGVSYQHNGLEYQGSKLTCDPVLPSTTLDLTDTYTETVMNADGVNITWNVSRLYGSFFENYVCFTGDDVSTVRLTCLFNETNLAAKVVVDMNAAAGQGLQLSSENKVVSHTHDFYNDCVDKPDWDEFDSFGSGSRTDPYVLCNGSQLADLRTRFSAGQAPGAMAGYYRIGRDLGQISGDQMISSSSSPFTGVIQGNGYSFGISINLSAQPLESYAALIKYTDGAVIDYFTVTNLTVTGNVVSNSLYLSSLVGNAKKTKISRITIGEVDVNITIGYDSLSARYAGLVSVADESEITDVSIEDIKFKADYTSMCSPTDNFFGGLSTLISGATSVRNIDIGEINYESNCGFFAASGLVSRIDDSGSSVVQAHIKKFTALSGASYGLALTNYGSIIAASVGEFTPKCFYLICEGAGLSRNNYGSISRSSAVWNAPTTYAPSSNIYMSGLVINNYGTLANSYVQGTMRKDTTSASTTISGLIQQGGTVSNTYSAVSYVGSGTAYSMLYQNNATFSNSYWDSELGSGATAAAPSAVSGITAKTTTQMKNQATFSGWDFTNIWKLDLNSYPSLR